MKNELLIDVDVKMHVDTKVARQAMDIVDIWLNEDGRRSLRGMCLNDGSYHTELVMNEDRSNE